VKAKKKVWKKKCRSVAAPKTYTFP